MQIATKCLNLKVKIQNRGARKGSHKEGERKMYELWYKDIEGEYHSEYYGTVLSVNNQIDLLRWAGRLDERYPVQVAKFKWDSIYTVRETENGEKEWEKEKN